MRHRLLLRCFESSETKPQDPVLTSSCGWLRPTILQLQLLTDISGKHHGQQAWFSWAVVHETGPWQVVPSLGFNWMSSDAADYYFGVKPSEASPGLPAYRAGSAVNTFARLSVNYTLNEHWSVVYLFQYDWLGSSIKDSPSIADDHVQTMFLGLYYEF